MATCNAVETSRIIYRAAMDTPIELEGFDYREAAKYIAITKDEYERMPPGLAQYLP